MKKLITLLAFAPIIGYGQIFQENFDGAGPGIAAWTLIDVDQQTPDESLAFVTESWVTVDRGGPTPNYGGPDGNMAALSTSFYDPAGTSDDWLISPPIDLTTQTSAFLNWDAKAQDGNYPDGYSLMLSPTGGNTVADFTVELFATDGENAVWTTRSVDLTAYVGSTVTIAFVNNSTDQYVLLVDNIAVNAEEIVIPVVYCAPTFFSVEPITNVTFAGINNDSPADDTINELEDFTAISGTVTPGMTYDIALQGNTAGTYENFFSVYFDWNMDSNFDGADEVYQIGSLTGSTGEDSNIVTGEILVPADAMVGVVRMRVVKYYDEFSPNACPDANDFSFGQVEDYSITVGELGAESFDKANFSYYPNPVANVLNMNYSNDISSVEIYSLQGQRVITQKIGSNAGQVDVSGLASGTYVVKVISADTVNTIKIVKL